MSSAHALLSLIAPIAPTPSQGAAGADVAADFQGLLAALMGGTAAPPDASRTQAAELADDQNDAEATTGFLAAPPPGQPTPLVQPPADVVSTDPQTQPPAEDGKTASVAPPAPEVRPAEPAADGPLVRPAETPPTKDAAAAKGSGVPTPEVRPEAPAEVSPETQPEAPAPSAKTEIAAKDAPPVLPPASTLTPAPTPLRPSADRARPLDAAGRAAEAETAGTETAARPAADASTVAAGPVEAVTASADRPDAAPPPVAPVATDASDPGASEAASEGPAAPDAPVQAAHAAVREHAAPSVLSRSAIDATAQVAAQILKRLDGRSTRFEMSLTPDELGRVDIKLDIDAEGRLAARLAFDNPAAAADLKGRADELRRQLEQQGFHLAEDAFEFAERDSGSSAFDGGRDDARHGRSRFNASARLNHEADAAILAPRGHAHSLSPSGVDLKV